MRIKCVIQTHVNFLNDSNAFELSELSKCVTSQMRWIKSQRGYCFFWKKKLTSALTWDSFANEICPRGVLLQKNKVSKFDSLYNYTSQCPNNGICAGLFCRQEVLSWGVCRTMNLPQLF